MKNETISVFSYCNWIQAPLVALALVAIMAASAVRYVGKACRR